MNPHLRRMCEQVRRLGWRHPGPPQPAKGTASAYCSLQPCWNRIRHSLCSLGYEPTQTLTCRAAAHACQRKTVAHMVAVQQALFAAARRLDGWNRRLRVVAQAAFLVGESGASFQVRAVFLLGTRQREGSLRCASWQRKQIPTFAKQLT